MYRIKQFILLGGDFFILYAGLFLALWLRYLKIPSVSLFNQLIASFSWLFLVGVIIMFVAGLYDLTRSRRIWGLAQRVLVSAGLWIIFGIAYFYLIAPQLISPKTILILTAGVAFLLIFLWRIFHNRFLSVSILTTNVVFAGVTPESVELMLFLKNHPERGFSVRGIVTELPALFPPDLSNLPCVNTLESLDSSSPFQVIVLSPASGNDSRLLASLYNNLFHQIEVIPLATFYETIFGRIPPFTFSAGWFLWNLREQQKKIYDRVRLLFDFSCAFLMGLFTLITLPFIALTIRLTSTGPVFFKQIRIGRNNREFTIFKFRTMRSLSPDGSAELFGPQFAAARDQRITPVGLFLRRTRLDELPQCLNILRGDMALIGPRPERPEFVKTLTEKMSFYSLRHLIKPGLTGWAQIHASYYGTIDENLRKLEYDLFYLKNRGLLLDIAILLKTLNIIARLGGR